MRKLNQAGYSAYLVGGGVRDLYLGKQPKDFDISTDARPGQIRKLFPNSNTIGRRFRLVQVFFKRGKVIEISTLRSLSEHDLDGPEAVLAHNNTYGSLDEDAQRRDLTINSLFYEIENQTILDHVDGVRDLDDSIIRIIGDPLRRINRDPVRMMRAIRHSARNGFTIEEKSWETICSCHAKLLLCPPSRIRDETLKDLYSGSAACWLHLALRSNLFFDIFHVYTDILHKKNKDGSTCGERLHSIFKVIDRINNTAVSSNTSRQPDYFILALVLLPWAETRYKLFSTTFKGPALFHLSKQIREDIDHELGQQLNLRRSLRQDITVLLTNLSQLIQHRTNDTWPKWLKKKSYFKRCSLFYLCYQEAVTGKEVDNDELGIEHNSHILQKPEQEQRSRETRKKPAFSSRSRGGIFGLKKDRHS